MMKKRTKIYLWLTYLMAAIIGIMIAIGVAGATGVWPEEWRF